MYVPFLMFLAVMCLNAQDCKVGGKRCVDHEQCCGGCCFDGQCVDTYRHCYEPSDVCRGHVCVGDETCLPYVPAECRGCEPLPICRDIERL